MGQILKRRGSPARRVDPEAFSIRSSSTWLSWERFKACHDTGSVGRHESRCTVTVTGPGPLSTGLGVTLCSKKFKFNLTQLSVWPGPQRRLATGPGARVTFKLSGMCK